MSLLRQLDYQEDALDALLYNYDQGQTRQIGVMATGLGKTSGVAAHIPRVFDHLVRRQGIHGGLLFIVHRREILYGAYETFKAAYPDKWIGIEMGDQHVTGDEDFIFASADSIGRLMGNRILKFEHRVFGAIITDEGHHLTIGSKWDNILNFMGVGPDRAQRLKLPCGNSPLSLLLTATPNRNDGAPLAPFVDADSSGRFNPSFEYDLPWGIRNGWAVDIRASHLVDGSGVTGADLAEESEIDFVSRFVRDYCADQKTLLFARSVRQSQVIARTLTDKRIVKAAHIDGTTDADLRRQLVSEYRDGDLDFMSNYGVFTEGTNVPGIQNVVLLRVIRSIVDFPQIVGRATRPHPDANVYALKTAAERLDAIARSVKPYANLYCLFPPEDWGNLSIVAQLTGRDTQVNLNNGQSLMETVDVLDYIEETMPEIPVRDFNGDLNDLKVSLKEVNPWTQTVYNEDLKAMSPLQWTQRDGGDTLALYLPKNPFATRSYEKVPVVIEFRRDGNGWEKRLVEVGGFVPSLGRPRKATSKVVGSDQNLQQAVAKLDGWLRRHDPGMYASVQRGANQPADAKLVKYLKNAGIKVAPDVTQGTAQLLAADHRITKALTNAYS